MPCVKRSRPVVNLQSNPYAVETDVVYLNMFGTDMIVLNSSEAMEDLLDKRSAIYSDKVTIALHIFRREADMTGRFS